MSSTEPAASAPARALRVVPSTEKRRVWVCGVCGVVDHWGEGWMWFGTLEGPPVKVRCPACVPAGVEVVKP